MSELPPPVFAPFVEALDELRTSITWKSVLKSFLNWKPKKVGKL
ncbi:MAG: hypothetical protein Greene07147_692 [Parcubacteria group bacterium Greene0714_7]|nr:MAG: hypothetical protein Greene07147_692 [Parcubacteria group bacterium Greene0714_7]